MNKILILNGSPRRGKSTTKIFVEAFTRHYEALGGQVLCLSARDPIPSGEEIIRLRNALEGVDGLGLFFPLYVDSIPSNLLSWLNAVESILNGSPGQKPLQVFYATQCGYPMTENMKHAAANCQCFTDAIHGQWLGGLSYGGGVMINGRPLEELGRKGEKLDGVFAGMARCVSQGKIIPESVTHPVFQRKSPLLFLLMVPLLNLIIRQDERKAGLDYRARPYDSLRFDWD